MLNDLYKIIEDRKINSPEGSYTARLMNRGEEKILKKIGEESMEVILASVSQGDQRLVEEMSDLFYHCLVLISYKNISLDQVYDELRARHKVSTK